VSWPVDSKGEPLRSCCLDSGRGSMDCRGDLACFGRIPEILVVLQPFSPCPQPITEAGCFHSLTGTVIRGTIRGTRLHFGPMILAGMTNREFEVDIRRITRIRSRASQASLRSSIRKRRYIR
jgi:hypothetical protein